MTVINVQNDQLVNTSKYLLKSAWQALGEGKVLVAVNACRKLNREFPQLVEGWALSSQVALRAGDARQALVFIDRALALDPGEGPCYLFRAQALLELKRLDEAIENAQHCAKLSLRDAAQQNNVATFLSMHCRNQELALPYFRQALALAPDNSQYRYSLAAVLRFVGELEEADQQLDKVIEQQSDNGEAWLIRSELRRQCTDSNHRAALESRLDIGCSEWRTEVQLRYALAKECEDIGDYPAAFDALSRGAGLRHANTCYEVQQDVDTIDSLIELFNADWFAQASEGDGNEEPIFIIGLPRSGTTLVERILSSHDSVFAAGELNDFALAMVALAERRAGKKLQRSELLLASARLEPVLLGRSYIERTRPFTGHSPHFIDKLPFNFLYCGLIAQALPKAKIIHVQRQPMDSCYAMYKRLFKQAYPMSYDQEDVGCYYLAYRRLMDHWQQLLPGRIHQIQYETLVDNQEAESRRLLSFCGLEWQERVLQFERNSEASTTASASQIRQPIYRSSMQQWRHYSEQLEPLVARLREGGVLVE